MTFELSKFNVQRLSTIAFAATFSFAPIHAFGANAICWPDDSTFEKEISDIEREIYKDNASDQAHSIARWGDEVRAWMEGLKSENPQVRKTAAKELGKLEEKAAAAVPALIRALKDPHKDVGFNATVALGMIRERDSLVVPALIEALKDSDEGIRASAARSLGNFGHKAFSALPALMETARHDPSSKVRVVAVSVLEEIENGEVSELVKAYKYAHENTMHFRREAIIANRRKKSVIPLVEIGKLTVPAFIELQKDADLKVRAAALTALDDFGRTLSYAVPVLMSATEEYEKEELGSLATEGLKKIEQLSSEAVLALLEALRDFGSGRREDTLVSILRSGPLNVRALIAALSSSSTAVQEAAEGAFGRIGEKAVPEMLEFLKDPDADVRSRAARGLGATGETTLTVPALLYALKDSSESVHNAAWKVLLDNADRFTPALNEALNHSDAAVRSEAANILNEIEERYTETLSTLRRNLYSDELDEEVRYDAVRALGKLGRTKASDVVPALIDALKDRSASVRAQAARELSGFGKKAADAVPALMEAASKDSDQSVRSAAGDALAWIR